MDSPKTPSPGGALYQASRAFMIIGLGTFVIAAASALAKREPFHTWFYVFAWWSYILFMDGWVYRHRKESLLLSHPGRFAFLAGWSVVLWFIFEAFNLRLNNWSYVNVPADRALRWIGYVAAFATVVPAILETADLVDTAGLVKEWKVKPLGWKKSVGPYFMAVGLAMAVLPVLWPSLFFPLVWGSFIFLLEPVNERLGLSSLLSDWRGGRLHRFVTLLVAGFFCGGLWEWWNAWAGSQWIYTVPGVSGPKIFEMPALGYLGFPPFAVEAFVMTVFASHLWERSRWPVRGILAAAGLAFCLVMCGAVDRFTVISFQ
jgi:hypothetical protein